MDGGMDHGGMGHGGMDHGGMDMCSMNMLFTWDYTNTCVIFKWWHIRGFSSFLLSFLAIIIISMFYEFSRYSISMWEAKTATRLDELSSTTNSQIRQFRLKKSILYGFQIGYSFMLMLVFMTYNGWLMIAVVLGAIIGNNLWGYKAGGRGMECH